MNYFLLIGIITTVAAILPILFFIIPLQYRELHQPKSEFKSINTTRVLLFFLEVALVVGMVPGIPRKTQLLNTPSINNWSKLASVTNPLPFLIAAIILVVIYRQKLD